MRFLWLVGDDDVPYLITAESEAKAFGKAITMRVAWATDGRAPTHTDYRDAIRWFRKADRLIDITEAEEVA